MLKITDKISVTSPKRTKMERQGVHAWFPYYAGFSEGFVTDILTNLELCEDNLILDPMNGSGMTTFAAQKQGIASIGVEINPAMVRIARAKNGTFSGRWDLGKIVPSIINKTKKKKIKCTFHEDTLGWFPEDVYVTLKRLEAVILERKEPDEYPLHPKLESFVNRMHIDRNDGGLCNLFLGALLLTARRVSVAQASKNPTWFKPGEAQQETNLDVLEEFESTVNLMDSDLRKAFRVQQDTQNFLVLESDAGKLPIKDELIDAIITSPPYLTRIDYAVGTSPELVLLGYESKEELRSIRRATMGSTCVTGGSYEIVQNWGKTCINLLKKINHHPSKASSGYYLKMHVQYFRDVEAILRECLRVLKPGACAILVVQDSWYKEICVPLGKIYAEMALKLGADSAETIQTEEVKNHMGLVNTRSRKYRKGKLQEHVVLIRNGGGHYK